MLIATLASCKTYRNIAYFADVSDSARVAIKNAHYEELHIRPDDVLDISVLTMDPAANMIFSAPSAMSTQATPTAPGAAGSTAPTLTSSGPSGASYVVDKRGDVQMPLLGNMHLAGLTTMDARDTVQHRAALYYNNPAVYVRFGNLKITILGEVTRPGTYILNGEKNTLLDALGLSGDLTIFGRRENALLIRDSLGYSELIRFNLQSKDIVSSDYYYLRQNDVLYITPNKARIASQDAVQNRNFAILASVLTIILAVIVRI
jgi:polysaccharide export outer membrane protein